MSLSPFGLSVALPLIAGLAVATLSAMAAEVPAGLAQSAGADIARLIAAAGGRDDPPEGAADAISAELSTLFDQLAAKAPDTVPAMPAAIAQAAHLALSAEHPATRAVMADYVREGLVEAASVGGLDPATQQVVASWNAADPVLRAGHGLELTQADADAFDRLAGRAGYASRLSATAFWDSKAEATQDRVQPARLAAWVAGAEAAWDRLDHDQRRIAVEVLDEDALPPQDLVAQITGTTDFPGWLGGITVTLTPAERQASPDLVRYLEGGAFAGPLIELLAIRAGMGGAALAAGSGGGAAGQLQRLNNWSAMTGEMSSWESYRYSTQGY